MAETILVVDDNALIRKMLTDALQAAGYRVVAAADIPLKRLVILLNAAVGGHGINKQQAEEIIEAPIFGVIPHDGDRFTAATGQGIPLVQKEPQSSPALQFMDLARHLSRAVA